MKSAVSQSIYALTIKMIGVLCYFYVYPDGAGTVGIDILSLTGVPSKSMPQLCGVFCYC